MILAALWVIGVAVLRGLSERKRLGIQPFTEEDWAEVRAQQHSDDANLARPKNIWFNLGLTVILMILLIFGGIAFVFFERRVDMRLKGIKSDRKAHV